MNAIENDDPAIGYIPNYPNVDSLTVVLRSGAHVLIPCDPVRAVEMNVPGDDKCTVTLQSGRVIIKERGEFMTEDMLWICGGHSGAKLKSII